MTATLLHNITYLATFDDDDRELENAAVLMDDHVIAAVGTSAELLTRYDPDRRIDLGGHLVMPGMVNTHHHFYQCLTRVMAQQSGTFDFLSTLYPVWERLDEQALYHSSLLAMAELLLSGCTTTVDHHYVFPRGMTLDCQMDAAETAGIRFHAARGAMSRGQSRGGLPPDSCVENEDAILADCERLIAQYHDPRPHAMRRIALAPCSPFSVTPDLMREVAQLARCHTGVGLHSHIAQDADEERFANAVYGMRSVAMAESVGWLGPDVWFAHSIFLNDAELDLFAATGTGVSYCPTANMRTGAGIARVPEMLRRGIPVSFGVDGAASSDSGNLFTELQRGLFLQRAAPRRNGNGDTDTGAGRVQPGDPSALSARQVLQMATRGGASVLGRTDIGRLSPGCSADLIAIDLNQLQFCGAQWDWLAAVVLCGTPRVNHSFVHGRQLVRDGELCVLDEQALMVGHRQEMARLYDF